MTIDAKNGASEIAPKLESPLAKIAILDTNNVQAVKIAPIRRKRDIKSKAPPVNCTPPRIETVAPVRPIELRKPNSWGICMIFGIPAAILKSATAYTITRITVRDLATI